MNNTSAEVALLPPFSEVWATYEAQGYRYGGDVLENVAFGYEIAQRIARAASLTRPIEADALIEAQSVMHEQGYAAGQADALERAAKPVMSEDVEAIWKRVKRFVFVNGSPDLVSDIVTLAAQSQEPKP
jgi:hypothetical protein